MPVGTGMNETLEVGPGTNISAATANVVSEWLTSMGTALPASQG